MSRPAQIDPRGARFTAAVTAVLLLVDVALGLVDGVAPTLAERIAQPAFLLLVVLAAIFVWSAAAGVARNPWSFVFRRLIRPRQRPGPSRGSQHDDRGSPTGNYATRPSPSRLSDKDQGDAAAAWRI